MAVAVESRCLLGRRPTLVRGVVVVDGVLGVVGDDRGGRPGVADVDAAVVAVVVPHAVRMARAAARGGEEGAGAAEGLRVEVVVRAGRRAAGGGRGRVWGPVALRWFVCGSLCAVWRCRRPCRSPARAEMRAEGGPVGRTGGGAGRGATSPRGARGAGRPGRCRTWRSGTGRWPCRQSRRSAAEACRAGLGLDDGDAAGSAQRTVARRRGRRGRCRSSGGCRRRAGAGCVRRYRVTSVGRRAARSPAPRGGPAAASASGRTRGPRRVRTARSPDVVRQPLLDRAAAPVRGS